MVARWPLHLPHDGRTPEELGPAARQRRRDRTVHEAGRIPRHGACVAVVRPFVQRRADRACPLRADGDLLAEARLAMKRARVMSPEATLRVLSKHSIPAFTGNA